MPSSSFSIIFNILLIIQIVLTSSTQNSQIRQLAHRRHKRDFMFAAGNSTDPMPSCFQSADRVFSPSNFLCTFKRQHFLRARACLEESEPISFLRCDQSCHPGGGHRRAELGKVFGENEMEGYERELDTLCTFQQCYAKCHEEIIGHICSPGQAAIATELVRTYLQWHSADLLDWHILTGNERILPESCAQLAHLELGNNHQPGKPMKRQKALETGEDPVLKLPVMFSIQFMNAIGHILLLERLLATLLSRTYERVKSVYFTAIWSILLCIYCGYTAWEQVMGHSIGQFEISAFIIFSAYFYSGMALAEFFCIIIISGYNGKKFKKQLRNQGQHNLSERFQLKDNIRTARQLGPTFFLHFINIMVSCEFPLVIHYGLITKLSTMQIYSSITHIAITTGNCLIEYTIISRHRILRQNAIHFINRILFKNDRIINIELANTNTTIIQENKAKESEQYFEILKQEWK